MPNLNLFYKGLLAHVYKMTRACRDVPVKPLLYITNECGLQKKIHILFA